MNETKQVKKEQKKPKYRDVAEMVRNVVDEPGFADEFDKRVALRQIVRSLMALRAAAGRSQQDIAAEMKCTQSRISKLEASTDNDLRLGDLTGYSGSLGFTVEIALKPAQWTLADEVKYHAFCMKAILDQMGNLAKKDHSIAKGIARFLNEARYNLGMMIEKAANTVASALRAFGKRNPLDQPHRLTIRVRTKKSDSLFSEIDPLDMSDDSCAAAVSR